MPLKFKKPLNRVILWLAIIAVVAVVGWFGFKVLTVEGNYSLDEKMARVFGWGITEASDEEVPESFRITSEDEKDEDEVEEEPALDLKPITQAPTNNCTAKYGNLMLVNPNYTVEEDFIAARRSELISLNATYGIRELNAWNGDNLMDTEAGTHLNEMLTAYETEYPGHEMQTVSCFRSVGTSCGRLCMPTGASDHHTGLACDLVDATYGTSLDSSLYEQHPDWQWLRDNSYKYGFVDRFPENWAGGSMDEPMNVDENGTTGLFETWHYRYVGVDFANEIATGKYNNGEYDSLEHYLKARGLADDLAAGTCK
ncbi:D-alanyl-D-alanine carboxypeptidase family protein [Candidatus Saccharibacteria bacterium]|nr:D-alanyl-D-alanine carboxypeptidase family protein [Candidatus Saccharibacteria bacterium]